MIYHINLILMYMSDWSRLITTCFQDGQVSFWSQNLEFKRIKHVRIFLIIILIRVNYTYFDVECIGGMLKCMIIRCLKIDDTWTSQEISWGGEG